MKRIEDQQQLMTKKQMEANLKVRLLIESRFLPATEQVYMLALSSSDNELTFWSALKTLVSHFD